MLAVLAGIEDDWAACVRYGELRRSHLDGAALVASGCVATYKHGGLGGGTVGRSQQESAAITALGRLVLRFMGRTQGETPVAAS